MGIFSRLFGQAGESESEPVGSPGPVTPIEEKLEQSDAERSEEQQKNLEALSEEGKSAWVPEGSIEAQRAADEAANPSN